MTATLTPALALAYLHELSTDIRAAVVLDARGERLAGDERLAVAARRLLDASAEGSDAAAAARPDGAPTMRGERTGEGLLLAVAAHDGPAIAVMAGRHALVPLLRHDLARALEALSTGPSDPS